MKTTPLIIYYCYYFACDDERAFGRDGGDVTCVLQRRRCVGD